MSDQSCVAPKEIDLFKTDDFRVFRLEGFDAIGIEVKGRVVVRPVLGWIGLNMATEAEIALKQERERAAASYRALQNPSNDLDTVICDCGVVDVCPQGRVGMAKRCAILKRLPATHLPDAPHK